VSLAFCQFYFYTELVCCSDSPNYTPKALEIAFEIEDHILEFFLLSFEF